MEHALIDQVLRGLNAAMTRKGLERAIAVGGRVLGDLFAGDAGAFREKSRHHATYQAMLARRECPVTRREAWTAVRVHEQVAMLPSELARGLSFTHHRLLLGVTGPEEKVALAREVLRGDLSKRDLEQRLADTAVPGPPRPGRPRSPQWLKGLKQVREGVDVAADPVVMEQALGLLDTPQLVDAVAELDAQIAALNDLRDGLQQRLSVLRRRAG